MFDIFQKISRIHILEEKREKKKMEEKGKEKRK